MVSPRILRPLALLTFGAAFLLAGCGEKGGDSVEFSSEVSEEELNIGEMLMGEKDTPETDAAVQEDLEERRALDARSIHYFAAGLSQPFNTVQARLFHAFLRQDDKAPPLRIFDAHDDIQLQIAEITVTIENGAKGIVLCPVDPEPLRELVAQAMARSIPVVVLGFTKEELPATANLAIDHRRVGEIAAGFVVERLGVKAMQDGLTQVLGRVIEISGTDDLQTAAERSRSEGFASVLDQHPGIQVVHRAPGRWNGVDSAARVLEAVRIQHETDVIFAHNDAMALGAYLALRNESRDDDFLIVGVDGVGGLDGGIAKVREQMLGATVSVPLLAREAVDAILALHRGKPLPESSVPEPELVTIANSFEMYRRHLRLPFGLDAEIE